MSMFTLLAAGAAPGGASTLIFILLLLVIFYFFMIRPQQKQQKQMQEFRNSLAKGDKVTTVGGIHGRIVGIKENTFLLEIAKGMVIEVEKNAINYQPAGAAKKEQPKDEDRKPEEPETTYQMEEDRNPNLD